MGLLFSKTETKNKVELETNYANGKFISFSKDGNEIIAQINKFTCNVPSDGVCDLHKSFLSVIDDYGNLHKVYLNEAKIIDKKITYKNASNYLPQKKVSFYTYSNIEEGEVVTKEEGIIISRQINTTDKIFINDDSRLTINLNGNSMSIPFTQPGLKLVEESGNKKYILEEDDNKYRLKYAKYKAKYLLLK